MPRTHDVVRPGDDGRRAGEILAARWMAEHWAARVEAARGWAAGSAVTAEDVAQEALWAAYERRDRLVDPAGERAWLLAFVRNKARETVRRRGRRGKRSPEEYVDSWNHPNPDERDDSRRERVLEAAHSLPGKQPEIVRLTLEGKDNDEIAASVELKNGTLRVYKHRAVQKLKQMLREDGIPKTDR